MQGNILFYVYRAPRLHNSCIIRPNVLRDEVLDFLLSDTTEDQTKYIRKMSSYFAINKLSE